MSSYQIYDDDVAIGPPYDTEREAGAALIDVLIEAARESNVSTDVADLTQFLKAHEFHIRAVNSTSTVSSAPSTPSAPKAGTQHYASVAWRSCAALLVLALAWYFPYIPQTISLDTVRDAVSNVISWVYPTFRTGGMLWPIDVYDNPEDYVNGTGI